MNILVLFDIDGVLLGHGGVEACWDKVSRKVWGVPFKMQKKVRAGKTEPQCFLGSLEKFGISEEEGRKGLPKAMKLLAEEFKEHCRANPLPGAKKLLIKLKELGVPYGVLTGNSKARAKVKLEKAGLGGFLKFGGYGDDSETKEEMMQHALLDIERALGKRFLYRNVVVIGDAPLDVKAGKHWGARTIAVATGLTSTKELKETRPDYFFEDLKDTEKVIKAIMGNI
ncbi:MAG: HAD family hydrolase [Candidatus Zixiibacteriota bacterium]